MRQCTRTLKGAAMMFPKYFWRKVAWLWLTVALLLALAILLDNHRDVWETQPSPQNTNQPLASQISQGHVLLQMGNCLACHTERGQPMGAGGRAFETPFGSVYSSNLTPHMTQGLGSWQPDDFWRALHYGKSKEGRLLTPVFPYKHTTLIMREEESIELLYSSTDSNCTRNGRADRDKQDGLITKNHKHKLMPGSVQVRFR